MSPLTWAPSCNVTLPEYSITFPSTFPSITTSPPKATTSPRTVPRTMTVPPKEVRSLQITSPLLTTTVLPNDGLLYASVQSGVPSLAIRVAADAVGMPESRACMPPVSTNVATSQSVVRATRRKNLQTTFNIQIG